MSSLRQIRYFVAVARSGSFTSAAEELHVSQPAVGLQVKFLEDRLGIALFDRHSRGAQLTEAGELYLGFAETILKTIQDSEQALARFQKNPCLSLRLGITPTLGRSILPQLLQKVTQSAQGMSITFQEGVSGDLIKSLLAGTLEAAFCYDPEPNPATIVTALYTEDLFLVGPTSLIGAGDEPVPFKTISKLPLVLSPRPSLLREIIEKAAAARKITFKTVTELDLIGLKREFLLRYDYCTISPYGLFRPEISDERINARRIVNPKLPRTMYMMVSNKLPAAATDQLQNLIEPLIKSEIQAGELHWRRPDPAPSRS